ncbi:MAG: elongation factor P maturation arginine rhamnosyltransferase EarP, partial [Rhizobacter sp.]|nr:elongation factor P maturation arginine rhamnosyltransferase EarP [Burkholderiales bacterium]
APIGDTNPDWKIAPRVAQTQFDALLATFDFLIVRGEDSFLRAQWAAKPFLWHIYPTEDGAHLIKLDAWLDHYCVGLEGSVSEAYRAASHAFNAAKSDATQSAAFELLAQNIDALTAHAVLWRSTLTRQTDLATRLVKFVAAHKGNNLG